MQKFLITELVYWDTSCTNFIMYQLLASNKPFWFQGKEKKITNNLSWDNTYSYGVCRMVLPCTRWNYWLQPTDRRCPVLENNILDTISIESKAANCQLSPWTKVSGMMLIPWKCLLYREPFFLTKELKGGRFGCITVSYWASMLELMWAMSIIISN
jgi:hypothetical protein